MSFRPIVLLLGLSISFVSGLNREAAAENLATGCQAKPSGLRHSEGRWMYRTIRTTGEKCWFRVGIGRTQRAERAASVAVREAQIDLAGSTAQTCVAAPTDPAPRNAQWRYRFDRGTHQKCWRLSSVVTRQIAVPRTRTSLPGRSKQIEKDNLRALRSVSAAQASLFEPDDRGGNTASAGHNDAPEGTPSPAQATTFESRWTAPTEFSPSMDATIHQEELPVLAPDNWKHPVPNITRSQTGQTSVVDAVRVAGLLIATIASVAIATGLYASINGASIGWMRGRASAFRPQNMRGHRLLPPRDSTIADILERLNREDDPARSALRRSGTPQAEPDRLSIFAKASMLDFGEVGRWATNVNDGVVQLKTK
jgi:hypothetical protein